MARENYVAHDARNRLVHAYLEHSLRRLCLVSCRIFSKIELHVIFMRQHELVRKIFGLACHYCTLKMVVHGRVGLAKSLDMIQLCELFRQ